MSKLLHRAIQANAVFSLATGLLLTVAPSTVADWLGIGVPGWLRLLGLALVGHAVMLWWVQSRRDITGWAKLNLAAIAPYPLLMAGLVVSQVVETSLGRTLALADGLVVGLIALGHWRGLHPAANSAAPSVS